ncbi:MAG: hypothetical protein GY797_30240 [Deltaproteobacteria bacterium]|nr:hypothetical protein [Deltaproteobacteria bacterium]
MDETAIGAFQWTLKAAILKFQGLYRRPFYSGTEEDKSFYQAISLKERACWGDIIKELEGMLRQYNFLFPESPEPRQQELF